MEPSSYLCGRSPSDNAISRLCTKTGAPMIPLGILGILHHAIIKAVSIWIANKSPRACADPQVLDDVRSRIASVRGWSISGDRPGIQEWLVARMTAQSSSLAGH